LFAVALTLLAWRVLFRSLRELRLLSQFSCDFLGPFWRNRRIVTQVIGASSWVIFILYVTSHFTYGYCTARDTDI